MDPFRYIIAPLGGNFTSRPSLRTAVTSDAYLDALATRSGLTRQQVEALIATQATYHIELARTSTPVEMVMGKFRIQPTSGGSFTTNDPDAQLIRDTLSVSYIIAQNEIDALREDCPVEKVGEVGHQGPVVTSVRGRPGNAANRYGVGTAHGCEVNGDNFRERRAEAVWPTAELVDSTGANAIALAVLDCTPTRLVLGGSPAGTTGTRYLKITASNGGFTISDLGLTPL